MDNPTDLDDFIRGKNSWTCRLCGCHVDGLLLSRHQDAFHGNRWPDYSGQMQENLREHMRAQEART
jgi:hypothetical protein